MLEVCQATVSCPHALFDPYPTLLTPLMSTSVCACNQQASYRRQLQSHGASLSFSNSSAWICLHRTSIQAAVAAADFLKLNFPAAFSASLLAWGLIEFQDVSTSL